MMTRLAVLILLAACSSADPSRRVEPAPLVRAPASASAASTPRPAESPKPSWQWFDVYRSKDGGKVVVAPLEGGAVIAQGSFLAVVVGGSLVQDPGDLIGLPEFINWDSMVLLSVPSSAALPRLERAVLPDGTQLSVHAGNLRGPSGWFLRQKASWTLLRKEPPPIDARITALPRLGKYERQRAEVLPSGEILVLRGGGSTDQAFVLPKDKGPPTVRPLHLDEVLFAQVAGRSSNGVVVCAESSDTFELKEGEWAKLALRADSCAMTSDGSLFVVADKRLQKRAPGATSFEAVPVPDKLAPEAVHATGDRVFVVAHFPEIVISNQPVKTPAVVGAENAPIGILDGGISGLDVTTGEVPSVSLDPPGPGTSACTSLVIYLGRDGARAKRLGERPEAAGLSVVEVKSTVPGKLVVDPASGHSDMKLQPSKKSRPAFALLPRSFDEGMKVVQALRKSESTSKDPPLLLCAKRP